MSTNAAAIRKKPVVKTIAFGVLTAAFYAAVFWKSDALMKFFTRGGLYAALPIATAIIFSFAHGAFASSLWSLLGIHARQGAVDHRAHAVRADFGDAIGRDRAYVPNRRGVWQAGLHGREASGLRR